MNRRTFMLCETLRSLMGKHPATGMRTTQKELASAVGIRPQTISLYLAGETQPSAEKCLAIADYFGVSADYLLTGTEDSERYAAMADSYRKCMDEKIERIAVLCSNAENLAVGLLGNEVNRNEHV